MPYHLHHEATADRRCMPKRGEGQSLIHEAIRQPEEGFSCYLLSFLVGCSHHRRQGETRVIRSVFGSWQGKGPSSGGSSGTTPCLLHVLIPWGGGTAKGGTT